MVVAEIINYIYGLFGYNPVSVLIVCMVVGGILGLIIVFKAESIWLPERVREFIQQPRIIFIKYVNDMPQLAGRKWIKKGVRKYINKEKVFILDDKNVVFSMFGNPIFFMDIDKCVPIPFGKLDEKLKDSTKVIKTALETKIFRDYVGSQSDRMYMIIIGLLMVAVIGVALYGQYQLGQQNTEIMKLTSKIIQLNSTKVPIIVR